MIERSMLRRCQLLGTITLSLLHATHAIISEAFNGYLFTLPDSPEVNLMTQRSAYQWCQNNNAKLLEIYDSRIQEIVAQFINARNSSPIYLGVRQIFTGGMRNSSSSSWIWVNGQHIAFGTAIGNQQTIDHAYGYLALNQPGFSYVADNQPSYKRGFICEYATALTCTGAFKHNDRCYTSSTEQQSWFDARSRCLGGGGDLASFDFATDQQSLSIFNGSWINPATPYWIGLRRQWWSWQSSGSEIKYTNWQEGHPQHSSSNCLCLMYPQRDWSECDCNQNSQFICLKAINEAVSTSTTSMPINGPSKPTSLGSSFIPTRETYSTSGQNIYSSIDTTVSKSCSYDCQYSNLSVGLGVGLGIGIPALLIILILAVLLIRQTRRSRKFEISLAEIKKEREATKSASAYESLYQRPAQSQDAYSSPAYQELNIIGNSGTMNPDD